ncbi:MAG: hypothetical protein HOP29_16970 [Phycisphaerales bacterium]|nr:hypothetical protein [Phycisphaerales bacterium]
MTQRKKQMTANWHRPSGVAFARFGRGWMMVACIAAAVAPAWAEVCLQPNTFSGGACVTDAECSPPASLCNMATHLCVPVSCDDNADCDPPASVCNLETLVCEGRGTVLLPPSCFGGYVAPDDFMQIDLPGFPVGMDSRIAINPVISSISGIVRTPGGALGGETQEFFAGMTLNLQGYGGLSIFNQDMVFGVQCKFETSAGIEGAATQQLTAQIDSITGEAFGFDPFWSMFRMTIGGDHGLPSPGQVRLVHDPMTGNFYTSSFFDVNYRIEYTGANAPFNPVRNVTGTATGVVRMVIGAEPTMLVRPVPFFNKREATIMSGEPLVLETFIRDTSPRLLRAYQQTLLKTISGGTSGNIVWDGTNPVINQAHVNPAWALSGAPGSIFSAVSTVLDRLTVTAALLNIPDGVQVNGLRYGGTFFYEATPNASGTFPINFLSPGAGQGFATTLSQAGTPTVPIPFKPFGAIVHVIATPCDNDDDCEAGLHCKIATGMCVACTNNGHCTDSMFCTGTETCVNDVCVDGADPNCSDSVACTVDSCSNAQSMCLHVPNDALCGVNQVCNLTLGCVASCTDVVPPFIVHNAGQPNSTRPCSGYIDPRIESSNGVALDRGTNSVDIRFNEPVFKIGGGAVDSTSFVVTETGGGAPPGVLSVVALDAMTFRVTLTRFITLRQWTTVRAVVQDVCANPIVNTGPGGVANEPDRVDMSHLPGDVSQNSSTQPADLINFRQAFAGGFAAACQPTTNYFDIDRNNTGLQPNDLIRFRQIAAGTSPATTVWLGKNILSARP